MICALEMKDLNVISANAFNVFEKVVSPIRPKVTEQKEIMKKHNAVCSMMSGSGPSVFGLFKNEEQARNACRVLIEYGADAFVCTPVK